jgi:hypothetical protein
MALELGSDPRLLALMLRTGKVVVEREKALAVASAKQR